MAKDYLLTFLSDDAVGVQYANTICIHDDELGGPRPGDEILDDIDTWLSTKYKDCLHSSVTLRVLRLFQIPAVYGDDSNIYTLAKNVAGSLSGPDTKLPREMALCLAFRSSHTSRRSMGHISLPSARASGYLDSDGLLNTAGDWWLKAGLLGDALLAGHDIGIGGVDGHLSFRVYSRKAHKLGEGDKTTDVSSYTRRRRPIWVRRRVTAP